MYSYCCNGCGHELHQEELVRLDGATGIYDGYGGIGIFGENHATCCWHEACYQKASFMEKKANKRSAHADNQGFGPACLEFLPNFEPSKAIEYSVYFETYDEAKGSDIIHLCKAGEYLLLSENDYEAAYSEFNRKQASDAWFSALGSVSTMSHEDKNAFYQQRVEYVESQIGMKNPNRIAATFTSLEQALEITNNFLPDGNWYLIVSGKQGKIQGAVYIRRKYDDDDNVEYQIGKSAS